ncbi:hypothetical protein SAY87_011306 [Trapa incisa]|uniref:Uncharacterized protein n=1 Tax=Trapa incisa TaxID=236973 RepID=A0AAN7GMR7_9MYRT|nr:hypothetical protein SAY87_011306 [Trapa incisa]
MEKKEVILSYLENSPTPSNSRRSAGKITARILRGRENLCFGWIAQNATIFGYSAGGLRVFINLGYGSRGHAYEWIRDEARMSNLHFKPVCKPSTKPSMGIFRLQEIDENWKFWHVQTLNLASNGSPGGCLFVSLSGVCPLKGSSWSHKTRRICPLGME